MKRLMTRIAVPALVAIGLPLVATSAAVGAVPQLTETQRIASQPQPNSTGVRPGFGQDVAVSADGSTMLVGAPGTTVGTAGDAGSAYLFRRGTSGAWALAHTFTPATPFGSGEFGISVALSADGTLAVIGQGSYAGTGLPGEWAGTYYQGGVAWAYRETAGTWSSPDALVKPRSASSELTQYYAQAVEVSRDGLHAAVTIPGTNAAVDWFSFSNGAWTRSQRVFMGTTATLGKPSLAVAGDGANDYLFAGWGYHNSAGAAPGVVYVLSKAVAATSWSGVSSTLEQPGGTTDSYFGSAVAANATGQTLVVGASEAAKPAPASGWGVAYVYTASGSGYQLATTLYGSDTSGTSHFGQDVAINGSGTRIVAGGWAAPQASYLFLQPSGGWPAGSMTESVALRMSDTTARDSYGNGLGISDDAATPPTSIIGLGNGISPNPPGSTTAWSQGALYIYEVNPTANAAPVAHDDSAYTTQQDATLTVAAPGVLGNDADPDGDALTAVKVTDQAHGTLSLGSDGSLTYQPSAGFSGTDTFTYRASDGTATSEPATVTITITPVSPVDSPPIATGESYSTPENTPLSVAAPGVLANDVDSDSTSLTAVKVGDPVHGTVSLNGDGSFTYTPVAGYVGSDGFTYRVSDGTATSNLVSVDIEVEWVDSAPVAANDTYVVLRDTTRTVADPGVLANDKDADGDDLTASAVTGPGHGSLTLSTNGGFTYKPAAGFVGDDTFTYRASDSELLSNIATVTLHVRVPTTLDVSASARTITYGHGVTLKTTLKKGGIALGGKTVTLQRCAWSNDGAASRCGTWKSIHNLTTTRNGVVSYRDRPPANAKYRWTYTGTSTLAPTASRAVSVLVRTVVGARTSSRAVGLRKTVTLTATVRPEHGGQWVLLERLTSNGWTPIYRIQLARVTSTTSRASITLRLLKVMTYKYRFVMSGHSCHEFNHSRAMVIRVS